MLKIEMHFLPDVYVTCDVCHGARYNRETLEVKFKGFSIADVLDMTVEDAAEFFKAVPPIRDKMAMLVEVGSGLRQGRTTGDDAVRRRGAARQARQGTVAPRDRQHALHPGRADDGLHFEDVRKLLEVLHRAGRHRGNTVVVIEHNLDVIKTADWVLDLGPEGGVKGGEIVAEGRARGGREGEGELYGKVSGAVAEGPGGGGCGGGVANHHWQE